MADTKPASPTLQGIPHELRNEIYSYLAITEPRTISGGQFTKISQDPRSSSDLWKQFQSAIAPHPLSLTCRQMHAEVNHILATTAGQTYDLIVENLDWEQLSLFHRFVAAYCSSHRASNTDVQPLLFEEVTLSLKLDGNILQSIQAFDEGCKTAAHPLPYRHGNVFDNLSVIRILPEDSINSGVSGDLGNEAESLTKAQAERARDDMWKIFIFHRIVGLDLKVMKLMANHFTDVVRSYGPTTKDNAGDT